jgi:leucyl-tRNA---protein transferase
MMFRPQCPACRQCQSLRVLADRFQPNRSQRRARKINDGVVELRIGPPAVSRAKLDLYDRFHAYQSIVKNWPEHPAKDEASYSDSFVNNPFRTEEWCYYLAGELVGVGYVDVLAGGLSAIYFFYEPNERRRSLGNFNVLNVIAEARRRAIPFVYLGYFVPGCSSLEYKASFAPNQVLGVNGRWHDFKE